MKKKSILFLLLVLTMMCSLVACGDEEKKTYDVDIQGHNAEIKVGETPDYASMFTVTVDGKDVPTSQGTIDASAVDLTRGGVYSVLYSYTDPSGKKHDGSATLTVKNDVVLKAKNARLMEGTTLDWTRLFSVTVNGEAKAVMSDDVDASAVNTEEAGEYEVTFAYDCDGEIYRTNATVTVCATGDETLAALLTDMDNYTIHRYAHDNEADYTDIFYRTADCLLVQQETAAFMYEYFTDGIVLRKLIKDGDAWKVDTNGIDAGYGRRPNLKLASNLEASNFYQIDDTWYVYEYYQAIFMRFILDLQNIESTEISLAFTDDVLSGIHTVLEDGTHLEDTITAVGSTTIEPSGVAHDIVITPTNKNTNEGVAIDYKTMFAVKLDGKSITVTDAMIDASKVTLDTAGDYTVTLTYSYGGTTESQTATLTVEAASAKTFEEIFAADYSNMTVVKTLTSSVTYKVDGQITSTVADPPIFYVAETNGTTTQYRQTSGAWTKKENFTTNYVRADLVFALPASLFSYDAATNTYVSGAYTSQETAVQEKIQAAVQKNAQMWMATYTLQDATVTLTVAGDYISKVKIDYAYKAGTSKYNKTVTLEFSEIGTTQMEIPPEVQELMGISSTSLMRAVTQPALASKRYAA